MIGRGDLRNTWPNWPTETTITRMARRESVLAEIARLAGKQGVVILAGYTLPELYGIRDALRRAKFGSALLTMARQ